MSSEQEGVIKYQLHHAQQALIPSPLFLEINAWRHIFCQLNMMGQDQARYDGYGFGNISHRYQATSSAFLITGTQTGHLNPLKPENYALVTSVHLAQNQIYSQGHCQPSSEALTHASVYAQDKTIQAVIHVHCPQIWRQTQALSLPNTSKSILYGTPEMAQAVTHLFNDLQGNIFTMLGHEDGVIAFGKTLAQASDILIRQFANALKIEVRDIYG